MYSCKIEADVAYVVLQAFTAKHCSGVVKCDETEN